MTAQDYIHRSLTGLKLTGEPQKFDSQKDLIDFIFKAVLSKKFRKYSVALEYQERIRAAIQMNVEADEPIKFAFPFGAYKLWRLTEAPEVDWAELFSLIYYAQWLKPIAENYKPGVWFDFSSDEVIVERVNNIPTSDTEAYKKTFLELTKFLQNYLPKNLRFTLTPVRDRYTPEEFEADIKDKIEMVRKEHNGFPELSDEERKMIELNVRLKPGQDEDPLWREKIGLIMEAYHLLSKRRPYTRAKDKILVFSAQIGNCVAVGSTKTSIAKFWAGVGALKKNNDAFIEYVLSPSQLENSEFDWQPILITGLSGKNFEKIRIIE